jgi:multidrug transporter EmrE-like cation transporter
METYIIWAIFWAFFGWLFNFFYKVIAHRNYDTYVVTAYSYTIAFSISLVWYLSRWDYELNLEKNLTLFGLAFWNMLFFYLSVISRVEALRNIDTVIFYPLYKTFGPIFVSMISIFYFRESLELLEVIWILVGISIPLLLINQNENRIQKNLTRGVLFLAITVLWWSISPIFPKLANVLLVNMDAFILYTFFLWIIFSYFGYKIHHRKMKKIYR